MVRLQINFKEFLYNMNSCRFKFYGPVNLLSRSVTSDWDTCPSVTMSKSIKLDGQEFSQNGIITWGYVKFFPFLC